LGTCVLIAGWQMIAGQRFERDPAQRCCLEKRSASEERYARAPALMNELSLLLSIG
jgi:hypothetical protein